MQDIRKIKLELREKSKEYRKSIDVNEKNEFDNRIRQSLFSIEKFKNAKTVLCYMSTDIEISTRELIQNLIDSGKTVAIPKCIDNTRNMEFYCIDSFSQTKKQTFGVYEPIIGVCEKLRDFRFSVCIVPGLVFDLEGYRLGYGKGYYDRFLEKYRGTKIGLCYENCIFEKIPHGFYDIASDYVITENRIITPEK